MRRPYRIFTIGTDGKFNGPSKNMECEDDDEAVGKAMQAVDGHDLELWDLMRLVARLPGKAPKAH
jgi:hypothetical protein